jgi:hypothetical protein
MSDYSIEVVRRVHDDGEGVYLEVGPCQDGNPGVVSLTTKNDTKSRDWYGNLYLSLSPEQARCLAVALVSRAEEAEKEAEG